MLDIFKKEFKHLRFGRPRTDTCSKCDLWHIKIKAEPSNSSYKKALETLQRKTEKAMKAMKEYRIASQLTSSDICVISADLQQVFSVPT